MLTFSAPLDKVGINRCVDVPSRISKALGATGRFPVRGTIEDVPFQSTLMPRGRGLHRLFVHSRVWRPRGLDAGDPVRVRLEHDADAEDVPVPAFLAEAFRRRPAARAGFAKQTTPLKREIVRWLFAAKGAETRERRMEMILDRLETGDLKRED